MSIPYFARLVGGACALGFVAFGQQAAVAQDAGPAGDSFAVFTGVDVTEDSWFVYGGGIFALNGLNQDGPALKAVVGGGEFNYISPFNPNGPLQRQGIQGDSFTFDALAGYRFYYNEFQFGVYGGVNYWDIDHENILSAGNPPTPPSVQANGDEYGLKIEGEITRATNDPYYIDVRGSFSTAFDTYWARARAGYDMGYMIIGPEGTALGNDDFDQLRIGGFVQFELLDTGVHVGASVGYADTDGSIGQDGVYGTGNLVTTF